MQRTTSTILLLLFTILPALAYAQIEEEVQVNLMEIWVKVTDKAGNAVTDLNPEDFQILVDGESLPPRCFDSTFARSLNSTAENGEAGAASGPASEGRSFIFYFDMLNTMPGDMDFLKARMADFLSESFREEDRAMVFALLPTVHLGLVQNWTSDRFTLMKVIQKMHGNMTLQASLQGNERNLLDMLYPSDARNENDGGGDRLSGQMSQEGLQQARLFAGSLARQDASRSRMTLHSFLSIASYLSGFPEQRPVLIYASGGFPLYPGQQYYQVVQKAVEQRLLQSPADITAIERPSTDFQNEVRNVMGRLNRLNVTVYSLDAKGLLTAQRGAERSAGEVRVGLDLFEQNQQLQDSLVLLSRETGGFAFINNQDYGRAMSDIIRDLNEQYWLCVDLPAFKKRGAYHKIEVKVDRPGVQVRHRKGYME